MPPKPPPEKGCLTHVDDKGEVHMVDVGGKPATHRSAVAVATVRLGAKALQYLKDGPAKGEVLATARIAGIQAAKQTSSLIPLCHPIALSHAAITIEVVDESIAIRAQAETHASTGVEMEALTAASIAALTVYDMLKAVDKGIEILSVKLLEKHGGRSGIWKHNESR